MIKTGDKKAANLPIIQKTIEFISDQTNGKMIVDKTLLEKPDFMKRWANMLIIERCDGDLRFKYSGSSVTEFYGGELQGSFVSKARHTNKSIKVMTDFYNKVIDHCKHSTVSGDINYIDKSINKWAMIVFPYKEKEEINACVGWAFPLQHLD